MVLVFLNEVNEEIFSFFGSDGKSLLIDKREDEDEGLFLFLLKIKGTKWLALNKFTLDERLPKRKCKAWSGKDEDAV